MNRLKFVYVYMVFLMCFDTNQVRLSTIAVYFPFKTAVNQR